MSDLEARALALFDEYVELAPPQRAAALSRLEAREPALHAALVKLLDADAATHPLENVALDAMLDTIEGDDDDPSSMRIGNRLGPWRIDRVLESGGMGTVYEASRADGQYVKQVALKCMRAGMSSPTLIEAFMRERNHLAQLDHPHIAPLLDGGIEADGRPWFAMRLVHGTALDLWADQQRLSLAERIRLLLQVCQALRYAHGRGMLHQDIKPGNLLVSADGHVHLIDFGLSAMMDGLESAPQPCVAVSNGYTAPEILSGAAASKASDIYSIGVMLYQLLVGDWPRPLPRLQASIIGLPILPPARPASLLALSATMDIAWKRGFRSPVRLSRSLRGDLDAISLKSVASSPADRYASVEALIEDMERWLTRYPVHARTTGRLHAMQRFLQRNALSSALAGGVVLVATTGAGVLGWSHFLDSRELRDMQAVSAVFEQTLGAVTLSGLSDARPSSRQLLEKAEVQLRGLSLRGNPAIKAKALASLARNYAAVGDYPHALALASEASQLLADEPVDASDTQAMLAMLLNLQARHADARAAATLGLQRSTSTRPTADLTTLDLLVELARANWELSEYDAAFDALAFAHETASGLSSRAASDLTVELLILRGQWHLQLMDLASAERDLRGAAAASRDGAPSWREHVEEAQLPLLLMQQRYDEAHERATALLAARRKRLGPDHPDTARSMRLQLEAAEQAPASGPLSPDALKAAHDSIASAYGTQHPEYARQLMLEARVRSRENAGAALEPARQAVQLLEGTLGPRHPTTLAAKEEQARRLLAFSRIAPGATGEALLGEAIGLLQEVIHATALRHWPSPTAKYALAQALRQRTSRGGAISASDRQHAETLLQDALVEASRHLGTRHATTTMIRDALISAHASVAAVPATTPATQRSPSP